MPDNEFVERLVELAGRERRPDTAAVVRVAPPDPERAEKRLNRLVDVYAEASGEKWRQRDSVRTEETISIRLPGNARAVAFAASGSMLVTRGWAPMEQLIGADGDDQKLAGTVVDAAGRLRLTEQIGAGESLEFEKLWRIKAGAADRNGTAAEPVLCRAVGAFRHVVRGLPVWGPASAAVTVAAGGGLDRVEVHARPTVEEPVDEVKVLRPDEAAVLVLRQLSGLLPGGDQDFGDLARPVSFQFGYFALGKRKAQSYLAPAYVAMVEVEGTGENGDREGRLGYVAVVNGAEKDYLHLARAGGEAKADHRGAP